MKVCKRDISNASKREPLHPDYAGGGGVRQFDAVMSGFEGNFTMGRVAFPCGFSAPPAISSMCTEEIQRARRSMYAPDRSWSGWGPFCRCLFVNDASFVEAEVGDISNETVGGRGNACRSLRDLDSVNKAKTVLGRSCGSTGLVLCFDLDTEYEIIAVPTPKIVGGGSLF